MLFRSPLGRNPRESHSGGALENSLYSGQHRGRVSALGREEQRSLWAEVGPEDGTATSEDEETEELDEVIEGLGEDTEEFEEHEVPADQEEDSDLQYSDTELEQEPFRRPYSFSDLDTLPQTPESVRSSTSNPPSRVFSARWVINSRKRQCARAKCAERTTRVWQPPADGSILGTTIGLETPSFIQRPATNRTNRASSRMASDSSPIDPTITVNVSQSTTSPPIPLPRLILHYYNELYFLPSPHDTTFADVQHLLNAARDKSLSFTLAAVTERDFGRWTRNPGFGRGGEEGYPPLSVCGEESWKEFLSVITGWLREEPGLERVGINVR